MVTPRTSRLFLQAWTLVLLDPENKGCGKKTGGVSDQQLITDIMSHHEHLYPASSLDRQAVKRFLKKERERSTGVIHGTARDNYVRWENVHEELRLLRASLIGKIAGKNSKHLQTRQDELEREEKDDLFRILGLH